MRASLARSVFLLAAASLACDSSTPNFVVGPTGGQVVQASAITLSATAPTLSIGQTMQLAAVVLDASGNVISSPDVKWSSSNSTIATVSVTGLVAAVALGTATVTATSGTASKTATVAVTESAPQEPVDSSVNAVVALPHLLDTSMPSAPAAGGKVIAVAAGGDLQAAINSALPGDAIELARGATFTGHFTLPNKGASTSWIVIRPASGTSLPAEGQRMTPSLAASLALPKLVTANTEAALSTDLGAHHYRLIGLEITVSPSLTSNYGIVLLGDGSSAQSTTASIAHDIVLDRAYVHGSSLVSLKRCIALNSASTAIIDSYVSECHGEGLDAQAIGGWNGPGPFKIVNNYLEGAAENIMFGGADPYIANLIPSDIEIRHNHFSKPVSWKGSRWLIKNIFELKAAQRVLVEGNVFENNWAAGQDGTAILMKSSNQDGTCTWCVTQDVTFRLNVVRNVGGGFALASNNPSETFPTIHARRIAVTNNLVYGIAAAGFEGRGQGFLLMGNLADAQISNNTVLGATNSALMFTPAGISTIRLSVRDNIMQGGDYGVFGDNTGVGKAALNAFAPDGSFFGNVLTISPTYVSAYPTGNSYPADLSSIGFVNPAGGDYRLSSSSPFKSTTSQKDPGVDMDALQNAVNGVVIP